LAELRKKSPNGTFPVKFVAIVAKQMVRSLETLHDQGVLHRDIKPANFCLGFGMDGSELNNIRCYLIDFGLSRRYMATNGNIRPVIKLQVLTQ
jgi:tau tubulin kinase